MIAAVLLLVAQTAAPRVAAARIEVNGPCAGISARVEGAGSFELVLDQPLSAGERKTFEVAVPLPASPLSAEWNTKLITEALASTAHAALIELVPARGLDGVSAELRARPRAALGDHGARLPWSALFVLGAAFAISLHQRRRIVVTSALALFASVAAVVLVHGLGAPLISAARIVEMRFGELPGEPWLAVEARRGVLRSDRIADERIEVEPSFAPVHCTTRESSPRFELTAPGATFVRSRTLQPGARRLAREVNAFGAFEASWLREPDGTWRAIGPWRLGDPLPTGKPGEPPGWLVPALPMGTSVFLGRLAAGELDLAFTGSDPPTWVRGLGL
ncbi:MAG TPA: hypothetical protein VM509_08100 [Planctomycetota bacterium]|nr:hypothetical protein [Planctomycetota bacterium]